MPEGMMWRKAVATERMMWRKTVVVERMMRRQMRGARRPGLLRDGVTGEE